MGRAPLQTKSLRIRVCNGAWLSLARALALGARGHRFKSCRPDHKLIDAVRKHLQMT